MAFKAYTERALVTSLSLPADDEPMFAGSHVMGQSWFVPRVGECGGVQDDHYG